MPGCEGVGVPSASSKLPPMQHLQGLGGAFLYARDPAALAAWYAARFGASFQQWGDTWGLELPGTDLDPAGRHATTTLAFFPAEGELPEVRTGRVNLRVIALRTPTPSSPEKPL